MWDCVYLCQMLKLHGKSGIHMGIYRCGIVYIYVRCWSCMVSQVYIWRSIGMELCIYLCQLLELRGKSGIHVGICSCRIVYSCWSCVVSKVYMWGSVVVGLCISMSDVAAAW